MKQGTTVNGSIITLNNNTVSIIDLENNHMQSLHFITKEKAKEYFNRFNIKPRGEKKERKTPQAKVYYSQLIIQL